jgi:hypothetical protein
MWFRELICRWFGHRWVYELAGRRCERCRDFEYVR